MRVSERIITGYRQETRTRFVPAQYDADGVQLESERMETYTVDVPVTEEIVRDMTTEEETAAQADAAMIPESAPSAEERIAELEAQNAMLLECVLEMSEIVYA